MAEAEVGDDVFGEDPTSSPWNARSPSCSAMRRRCSSRPGRSATSWASGCWCAGQELVCDSLAHLARAEFGAAAVFSGITFRTWQADRGRLDVARIADLIAPDAGPHLVSTAAIAVENTHNFGGGTVQPAEAVAAVVELARTYDLRLHLDGARLWNAHVATGRSMAELAADFDTVSVCLSKGLGRRSVRCSYRAPSGSPRHGSGASARRRDAPGRRARRRRAVRARQHVERLADDHARAPPAGRRARR